MHSKPIATTGPNSLRPIGFAETILIFAILLGVSCMVAVGLRTWQRVRDREFHVDDGLIWLGLIFNLIQYAVTAWGATVGIGTPDSLLPGPMMNSARRVIYWLNVTNVLALGFTKASICTTLLRLNSGTCHRKTTWILWLIMTAISISTAITFIFILMSSELSGRRKQSVGAWHILIYPAMGLFILVDIALAVIPIFIIRGLKMRKSLKLSTGAILALGGVACIASILCIPPQVVFDDTGVDELYKIGSLVFWQNIETGLGIIASCLPTLRRLVKSFDAPGRPPYYKPHYSGGAGHTACNIAGRLQRDSQPSPDPRAGNPMALQPLRAISPSPRDSQRQRGAWIDRSSMTALD